MQVISKLYWVETIPCRKIGMNEHSGICVYEKKDVYVT